jgi:hypothetical protein
MTVGRASSDRVWPNVASAAQLPNVAAATIQSALLQVGDICPVTGGPTYTCTTETLGAAVWAVIGASDVLFRWNQTNTAQFGAAVDTGIGPNIVGLGISTIAGGPNGTLLRCSSTELDIGGVLIPIVLPSALPRRYVVRVRFYELAFTDAVNAGRNSIGIVWASDATAQHLLALSIQNMLAYVGDFALDAGAPFSPSLNLNGQIVTAYGSGQSGLTLEFEVSARRPTTAQPIMSVHMVGSGQSPTPPPDTCAIADGNTEFAAAFPSSWAGVTLGTVGLLIANTDVTTAWDVDIESLEVLVHPDDRA